MAGLYDNILPSLGMTQVTTGGFFLARNRNFIPDFFPTFQASLAVNSGAIVIPAVIRDGHSIYLNLDIRVNEDGLIVYRQLPASKMTFPARLPIQGSDQELLRKTLDITTMATIGLMENFLCKVKKIIRDGAVPDFTLETEAAELSTTEPSGAMNPWGGDGTTARNASGTGWEVSRMEPSDDGRTLNIEVSPRQDLRTITVNATVERLQEETDEPLDQHIPVPRHELVERSDGTVARVETVDGEVLDDGEDPPATAADDMAIDNAARDFRDTAERELEALRSEAQRSDRPPIDPIEEEWENRRLMHYDMVPDSHADTLAQTDTINDIQTADGRTVTFNNSTILRRIPSAPYTLNGSNSAAQYTTFTDSATLAPRSPLSLINAEQLIREIRGRLEESLSGERGNHNAIPETINVSINMIENALRTVEDNGAS